MQFKKTDCPLRAVLSNNEIGYADHELIWEELSSKFHSDIKENKASVEVKKQKQRELSGKGGGGERV